VLPFTDMSAEKDQEWLCDGVAEEILTTLSQLKGLRVAARASAFAFRGHGDDLRAIGDKLQVATVLDGSVRRAGDRLRITVRLSDAANGYQIWSDRYDRDVKDVFDVQDEIARTIAERLRLDLAGDEAPRAVRHTENQEAYELCLRGRHLWYARSKGSLLRARALYEEAIRKDSEYVLPHVGLGELFLVQTLYGYELEHVGIPAARAAIGRALALNEHVADAHRALGLSRLFFDYDMQGAERAFERALELDPSGGLSNVWHAFPMWPGREQVAIAAARRACELDPLNVYIQSVAGAIFDFWDRTDLAQKQFDKALELDRNYPLVLYLAGGAYSRLGRHDEALPLLARSVEVSERTPFYVSYNAWALARAGHTDDARAGLRELEARGSSEHVQPLQRAVVHGALGESDRAFALLEEAAQARNGWLCAPRMPMFEDFRGDPRFGEHLRRIKHADAATSGKRMLPP
jgi:serine/threonine-protein kinase